MNVIFKIVIGVFMKKIIIYALSALLINFSADFAFAKKDPWECYNNGSIVDSSREGRIHTPNGNYSTYGSEGVPTELTIPDVNGKHLLRIPIETQLSPSPAYLDAHEIRLKVREMASQLLETWNPAALNNKIAYITTFTPQHDLRMPTPFGQYLREAFMYEFNNRGFPVRDFSGRSLIINQDGFAYGISDNDYKISVKNNNAVLVTGSFYADHSFLFMNVRMIRGSDGMLLRTAQTVFTLNPTLSRMTGRNYKPRPVLSAGELPIVKRK